MAASAAAEACDGLSHSAADCTAAPSLRDTGFLGRIDKCTGEWKLIFGTSHSGALKHLLLLVFCGDKIYFSIPNTK